MNPHSSPTSRRISICRLTLTHHLSCHRPLMDCSYASHTTSTINLLSGRLFPQLCRPTIQVRRTPCLRPTRRNLTLAAWIFLLLPCLSSSFLRLPPLLLSYTRTSFSRPPHHRICHSLFCFLIGLRFLRIVFLLWTGLILSMPSGVGPLLSPSRAIRQFPLWFFSRLTVSVATTS